MLFQKLVEQHRVHRVVADAVDFTLAIAHREVRINLRHFLRDQTELRGAFAVGFVVERHWPERQDRFTRLVHRFDLFLETLRRTDGAKLTGRIDDHCDAIGICRCSITNTGDEGGGVRPGTSTWAAVDTGITNPNGIRFGGYAQVSNVNVLIAGLMDSARGLSHRDVAATSCVAIKSVSADGCIETA